MAAFFDISMLRAHEAAAHSVATLELGRAPRPDRGCLIATWTVGPNGALVCHWTQDDPRFAPPPD
ncbi:MAG TPA: hypothetical protein VHO91_01380 [Rhodopila sp.]|nr:hypothetical protein [Rhodopila sp.]